MISRRRILKLGALAAPAIITRRSYAWSHGSAAVAPASPFNLVLNFDASTSGAPSSFFTAAANAQSQLQTSIRNAITVTIQVGYNSINGSAISNVDSTGFPQSGPFSYSAIKTALAAGTISSVRSSMIANMPSGSTFGGFTNWQAASAQQKALGLGTGFSPDGYIGIGGAIPTANLVGVFLHEITHALGRVFSGQTIQMFTRFTAANTPNVSSNTPAASSYFSIDGGVTKLADYDTSGDDSDFLNGPDGSGVQDSGQTNDDALDAYYITTPPINFQVLSTVDKQLLDCMGFTIAY